MLPVVETEKTKHERARLGMEANASAQRPPKTGVIPPFAMSTYKMSGELWFNPGTDDLQTAIGYQQTAGRWIKQHNFNHHDFNFFMTRGIRTWSQNNRFIPSTGQFTRDPSILHLVMSKTCSWSTEENNRCQLARLFTSVEGIIHPEMKDGGLKVTVLWLRG